jgi:phage-related holin
MSIVTIKKSIAGLCAALTAAWGWFGWLAVAFIACLALDYLTGSVAAGRRGEWSSEAAREGIWHKVGSIVAVAASALLDIVVGLVANNIPGLLPFSYTVLLCPVVLVWYILTELGSIAENAGKLGAPVPPFLRSFIALLRAAAEKAGEKGDKR